MILSEQIKLCRKQLGMSQADLADAIWVSRNTVSNWERGDTTPDIQSLVLMSALFGLSSTEMVKGDEQVMAQALERDKNHLIIAGEASDIGGEQPDSRNHATILNLFGLRSTGGPAHGKFRRRRCHRPIRTLVSPGTCRNVVQPRSLPHLG
ncbi:MAG: helix-turn-helix transcriptional regulator [Collinsella sp.]